MIYAIPKIIRNTIKAGATVHTKYTSTPPTDIVIKEKIPRTNTTVRMMNPMMREIRFIKIVPKKSSTFQARVRSSVIRFQGDTQERSSSGIEKNLTINQSKFFQTLKN